MVVRSEKGNFPIFCSGMILWYFMSGIEYGLTLANMNDYLLHVGAPQKAIGRAFTVFALSGLLSSPVYGHICDKLKSVYIPIMTAIIFSIAGSLIMALGGNLNMIYVGRFLMGFGWGVDGPIIGKIALLRQEDAGTFIPILLLMRQVGIIFGPFLIFWTKTWDFSLMGYPINPYNSATFLISIIWSMVLLYNVFAASYEPSMNTYESRAMNELETQDLNASKCTKYKYKQVKPLPVITEQINVCMVSSLSAYMLQSTLESMVTPLTRRLMGWQQAENAAFFIWVGVAAVIGYMSVTFLSRCLKPRTTLCLGVAIEFVILILMMIMLPLATFRIFWLAPAFVSITTFFVFFLPFIVVSSATLMSKFTDESEQSTIQGIRVAAERLAQICGPLWSAEVLHNIYLVFLFPAMFLIITMALTLLSWSWLDNQLFKKDRQIKRPESDSFEASEKRLIAEEIH